MPVEIRELVIRAITTLNDDDDDEDDDDDGPGQSGQPDTSAIVAECVRQVMLILKKKGER
ncbi:MAG: hypothetical protein RL748_2361 [Pseudomonadota bacterium]|jgi:hypothetical protein